MQTSFGVWFLKESVLTEQYDAEWNLKRYNSRKEQVRTFESMEMPQA